jgi:hypothetical protein
MKKLLVFFFICLAFMCTAQQRLILPCHDGPPTGERPQPRGSIGEVEAGRRRDVYRDQKNNRIGLIDPDGYDPCAFRELLLYLTDRKNGYNGLRIYLGVEPTNFKQVVLVFVPTIDTVIGGWRVNRDDTSACHIILNQGLKKLWHQEASTYIREYRERHVPSFNQNYMDEYGQSSDVDSNYAETNNLWYDISLFKPGTDPYDRTTGMITVLQKLINNGEVDKVKIDMAAFDHTESLDFFYHIMLIFRFYQKAELKASFDGNNSILVFYDRFLDKVKKTFANIKKTDKNIAGLSYDQLFAFRKILGSFGYTDTGVPCPPPPSGQTCDKLGAILP